MAYIIDVIYEIDLEPGGRIIILLTVFRKTREGAQKSDVDRAVRAKGSCQAEREMTITHQFERNA